MPSDPPPSLCYHCPFLFLSPAMCLPSNWRSCSLPLCTKGFTQQAYRLSGFHYQLRSTRPLAPNYSFCLSVRLDGDTPDTSFNCSHKSRYIGIYVRYPSLCVYLLLFKGLLWLLEYCWILIRALTSTVIFWPYIRLATPKPTRNKIFTWPNLGCGIYSNMYLHSLFLDSHYLTEA